MKIIDLSGEWLCEYGTFRLPGSANDSKIGKKQERYTEYTKEAVRAARQKYEYIGELFIEKEIELEADYTNSYAELFMERVNVCSALWIDGKKIGRDKIELSAPHRYDISQHLTKGRHLFRIKLDNRNLLNIHEMASGYSIDTQDYWLGIIGKFELRILPKLHISYAQIFTDANTLSIKLCINSHCTGFKEICDFKIRMNVITPDDIRLHTEEYNCSVRNRREMITLIYRIEGDIQEWDEFHPDLYTLHAELIYNNSTEAYDESFGIRKIETQGKHIFINDRRIFLRGTTDAATFPLTGYPPVDVDYWLKHFGTVKQYGLNHIRCHAWCPPDAAFTAADRLGIYLAVEMPLWLNYDVCPLDTGYDDIHKYYFTNEAFEISKNYGNHPSFIMFSNGNELLGDHEMLEYITTQIKAVDNRRLYTLTSNFPHFIKPCEDYYCAVEAAGKRLRLQVFYDETAESTFLTYDEAINNTDIPVVSFEVGQYCMYPDTDVIDKYTGNMLPVNFEAVKDEMLRKGVYKKRDRYITASGKFSALMYKEEIEAAMRTKDMAGFQLLGLWDYSGQCTSTVGLLDVFGDNKGIVSSDEFKSFCNDVVPLIKMKRLYNIGDTFHAEATLYDFGEVKQSNKNFILEMYSDNKLLYSAQSSGVFNFKLDFISDASVVKVLLRYGEYYNSWNIFVFDNKHRTNDVKVYTDISGIDFSKHEKAIILGTTENLKNPIAGDFRPTFWSPMFFKSDRTSGLWCDFKHPVFNSFPTEEYIDFQWKKPIDNCVSVELSNLPGDFEVLLEPIPNFGNNLQRSSLFETRVGNMDILFCGFDVNAEDIASIALKQSIYEYAASEEFKPKQLIETKTFLNLFKEE